ncbi:hypothetical protein [Murimonas intestini]|uniref:Uncharacterized protein n=1 Tax=Murimonas intestini TaxID=1337051 RepID=A0AB73SZJ7_9FIRM|nr:hypothetical protein [Murimonas intestini]MCR1885232.1 hypothetical protein [Murimonas intestini]
MWKNYMRLYNKPECEISDTLNKMIMAECQDEGYQLGENELRRLLDFIQDQDIRLDESMTGRNI